MLEKYQKKWSLAQPHLMLRTKTSEIYKVDLAGKSAILKVIKGQGLSSESDSRYTLQCFAGSGTALLLESDPEAHLLEFLDGESLKTLIDQGKEDEAITVTCETIGKLHSYSGPIPTQAFSMERNFQSLFLRVQTIAVDPLLTKGAEIAKYLLATQQDQRLLHGDLHHDNILRSSSRGWLSIDPKCLFGERTYETSNTFYNPRGPNYNLHLKSNIERKSRLFSTHLRLDQKRVLQYAFAYGCLSAAWQLEDQENERPTIDVARSILSVLESI